MRKMPHPTGRRSLVQTAEGEARRRENMRVRFFSGLIATALAAQPTTAETWRDGFVSRVEALALIQTLNASLLASRSATTTLEKWCADHKMSAAPKILARRVSGAEKPPSEETRRRLDVGANEPIKYRRVQLACGEHVLSEADNWYVPGRLSDDMNRALETTETPFGKAIAPLQPFRRTVEMKLRWSPLPEGWEASATGASPDKASGALSIPHDLFEHTAVVYARDHRPLSEVHETYTREILEFPAPSSPGE
jgi:chorismate-pyruvate lyase